jgi:hypothetical protein
VSLRHRLDQLLENFTAELVRLVAAHSRELLRTIATPSVAPTRKQAAAKRKIEAPKSPARAPKGPRVVAVAKAPKPAATPRPAPPAKRAAAAPRIVPVAVPVARTGSALERALLSALRASPVALADLLESAGIDADEMPEARKLVESLIARGLIGESTFSGAPLLFAKAPVRTPAKRRPRAVATATVTPLLSPAAADAPAAAAAPEPAWRPTVIRRKKVVASGNESSSAEG